MAKIARTPYNGSRWVTRRVSTDTTLNQKLTGYCIFVNDGVNLDVNFLDSGSYFKVILRQDSTANLTISFPAMEGVLVSDDGSGITLTNAGESGQTNLILASGATAGSYVDLICDGDKWYVTGMAHGVNWTQS